MTRPPLAAAPRHLAPEVQNVPSHSDRFPSLEAAKEFCCFFLFFFSGLLPHRLTKEALPPPQLFEASLGLLPPPRPQPWPQSGGLCSVFPPSLLCVCPAPASQSAVTKIAILARNACRLTCQGRPNMPRHYLRDYKNIFFYENVCPPTAITSSGLSKQIKTTTNEHPAVTEVVFPHF